MEAGALGLNGLVVVPLVEMLTGNAHILALIQLHCMVAKIVAML